jgi:hypothetical protein
MTSNARLVLLLAAPLIGLTGCVNKEVTEPYRHADYDAAQILDVLLGDDMKAKLDAEAQIDEIPAAKRLAILAEVREKGDDKARLIVAEHLGRMTGEGAARAILLEMKENDPDRIVRYKAGKALEKIDAP